MVVDGCLEIATFSWSFFGQHLCPDNGTTKENTSENPSTNGFYPSSKPLPRLSALPESTPASNNPSFAAARGIFLNRAAHATPLSIPFYGLNCNPNSSPWPTWHLRTWEIPVWSSLRLHAQSRSFSRCSLLFFEHSKNSLHIAPAHLLYPETWSTRCLAQCLAFSNPTINSSRMNGSMFH